MMLSSVVEVHNNARIAAAGVAASLMKPIRQAVLRQAILDVLTTHPIQVRPAASPPVEPVIVEPAAGARVLVAEDNVVNQRIVAGILQKRGFVVETVGNGRLAIEAIAARAFDLVLMDVQMPEMDGFEATAAIRAAEATTGGRIPIVALTAHAMKGDRDKCLAAGMDTYVSKPVRAAELLEAISPYLRTRRSAGSPAVEPAAGSRSPQSPAFDLEEALDRVGHDEELLSELGDIFCRESSELLGRLDGRLAAGDLDGAARAAHTLRGSASNFGARPTVEAARELEQLARAGDLAAARRQSAVLGARLADLIGQLRRVPQRVTV
jgi:CheY-like chemotaxis protein/HPt (histidine-containing phosphotransfer) domain-containing protein